MLSNIEVNCYNLLILTAFVPSRTVWRIFQAVECFHPYFPISIIIPIKVRRNNKRMSVFYDNRGQGSAQRSKDQQQESYLL